MIGSNDALLFEIEQRLGAIAQNVGLHSPRAKFLHDAGRLAARAKIDMTNIEKRIFFFCCSVELLEIPHRHRGVENHLAFLLCLVQNLRRLREREGGPKKRKNEQESKPYCHRPPSEHGRGAPMVARNRAGMEPALTVTPDYRFPLTASMNPEA